MDFTLKVMGSASAKPVIERFQSAQVLSVRGRSFLIDCGEGVQMQLQRFGVSPMKIDSIFISHIHGDHVFGIFGLLSTMGMLARPTPLNIYAPVSFGPILKFFLSYYGEGVGFEIRHIPLKMKELEQVYDTKSFEILAFPLNHGIETFGFIFREKKPPLNVWKHMLSRYEFTLTEIGTLKRGEDVVREDGEVIRCADAAYEPWEPRSFAYCSDTAPFPEEASIVAGVDLLYHETTYLAEHVEMAAQRHHTTTLQAAQCALDAGAKRLVIGHYTSRVRDISLFEAECRTIFPESYAASDGSVFDIPLVKKG